MNRFIINVNISWVCIQGQESIWWDCSWNQLFSPVYRFLPWGCDDTPLSMWSCYPVPSFRHRFGYLFLSVLVIDFLFIFSVWKLSFFFLDLVSAFSFHEFPFSLEFLSFWSWFVFEVYCVRIQLFIFSILVSLRKVLPVHAILKLFLSFWFKVSKCWSFCGDLLLLFWIWLTLFLSSFLVILFSFFISLRFIWFD